MRIDSHQHFWNFSPIEHAWMTDEMGALKQNFLPEALEPLLKAVGLDGCIAVQARQSLEETRWLLGLAEKHDFILGVVGWLDLCSDALAGQLAQFARHPKLVGVRHVVQDEADDHFMLRADFRNGIAQLEEFGLVYDLLLFPRHLPVAVELVREFPEQAFVLDHIAKPRIAEGIISPWDRDLRALAEFQNVSCKLSGMVTEARWDAWRSTDFLPYLDTVFAAFGPERLMIGSDWPVCTVAGTYQATMGIMLDYLEQFPAAVREQVLGENCARIYGIQPGAGRVSGRKRLRL